MKYLMKKSVTLKARDVNAYFKNKRLASNSVTRKGVKFEESDLTPEGLKALTDMGVIEKIIPKRPVVHNPPAPETETEKAGRTGKPKKPV